jgi:CubicO group peptidase (beta-lactamase class C family)
VSARRWLTAVLLVGAPTALAAQAKPDWAAFDKYVAKAAADWRVPALAIAVVKDDSVVFAKGYGVLQKGSSQPANEHTRFAIGSTTKAMTSASIAMLVDEGKLNLDDPVTKYIPELQLSDPWVTRQLTIRDLLTHRSGLPGTDLFWASNWKYSQADVIRGLRYIQPTASFRSQWQYHNVLYALNGLIIERVSGMPWEQFVKKRIFEPLGMNETLALVSMIAGQPNVAVPHALVNDSVTVVPVRSTDPVASAGSVWSSVSDMAKWMRFVIDSGRVGNKRLIQQRTFAELVTPQIQAPMEEYPALQLAKPDFFSYGLGWFIQDYRGQQVWMHTGSINGLCAIIGIEPNKRLGVYVLENLDHAEIRHGLMYSAFDLFENGPRRDWSADLKPIFARPPRATAAQAARATSGPSLPLERYAGTYVDSAYGNVNVTVQNGALQAAVVTDPAVPLEPVSFEAFRTKPSDGARPTVLTFVPDGSGGVSGVRVANILFARARAQQR